MSDLHDMRIKIQKAACKAFNRSNQTNACVQEVRVGTTDHSYDLYEKGKVAGGVTTGTWKTSKGRNNTGAQDHAISELLWLELIQTVKRRVLILTDLQMVEGLLNRFQNAGFTKPIEIWHFNYRTRRICKKGLLQ